MITQLKSTLGILLLALLALLGAVHPASAKTTDAVQVAEALANAENANDRAAMRALIAPGAILVTDPCIQGGAAGHEGGIGDNSRANYAHVAPSNARQTAPGTVTADAVTTGGDMPAQLPHPLLQHVTFTVADGQVTQAMIHLDPQTRRVVQAMGPPPCMPPIGQSSEWLLPGLPALAAVGLALAGLALRVRVAAR